MKKILISLPMLALLGSCSSGDSAKLDTLLNIANSGSAQNLAKIAASADPKPLQKPCLTPSASSGNATPRNWPGT